MTIKQHGGVFGRNPTFNEIGGTLTTAAQPNITSLGTQTSNLAFADGNGIDFSATAGTGTSELFDDYEEGEFDGIIADASSGGNTGSTEPGTYTKVGNVVTIVITLQNIDTTGLTAGNDLYMQGLPFTAASLPGGAFATSAVRPAGITLSEGSLIAEILDGTSYISFREYGSNGIGALPVSAVTSGSGDISFSITYFAA